MEKQINNLKDYLVNNLPKYLRRYETKTISLPDLEEKNIIVGTVDINKYDSEILCSILPESEYENEISLEETSVALTVTISLIFRKDVYANLVARMMKYCDALREALYSDYSLNDTCINSTIGERKMYLDCGTTPQTATGFEFTLTIEL